MRAIVRSEPVEVREFRAAEAFVDRLIAKRDADHGKIPLTDAERRSWDRRIAKAVQIELSRWTVAYMLGHHDLALKEREEK